MSEGSLYFLPVAVTVWLFTSLPADLRLWLDLSALVVFLAGIFVVARYKAALSAADSAVRSMETERQAAVLRAERISAENVKLEAKVVELTGRTDLSDLAVTVQSIAETQKETLLILREIRTATVPNR